MSQDSIFKPLVMLRIDSPIGPENEDFPEGMGVNVNTSSAIDLAKLAPDLRTEVDLLLERHGIIRFLNAHFFEGRYEGRQSFLPHFDADSVVAANEECPNDPRDYDLLFFPATRTSEWMQSTAKKWGIDKRLVEIGANTGDKFLNLFDTIGRGLINDPTHVSRTDYSGFIKDMGPQVVRSEFKKFPGSAILFREQFPSPKPRRLLHGTYVEGGATSEGRVLFANL
jgi:hypothetical protein